MPKVRVRHHPPGTPKGEPSTRDPIDLSDDCIRELPMRPSRLPRMNGRACITFILVLLPATGWSQQERAKGTVTGHVLCADVNLPARLAQMWLLPLRKPQVHGSEQKPDGMEQVAAQSKIDGSFVFPRVAPGEYYVSVTYSGYATPESGFPHENLRNT